jgi:lipid-A-disaccharide synthase
MSNAPLFFLIVGEASGDLLGARLMAALKKRTDGNVRFAGIGGPRMQAEGIELFFPQAELAHVGLFEVLRHIPNLLRRINETVAEVERQCPVALITIDSPDFCFRVAKQLKGKGIPLIHYVAPSVWAWRPGRAKKIARFLDHLLALLPFEPPYFTKENLPCTFVGHSIVESDADKGNAARFRAHYNVPDDAMLLAVLPGSRMSEINRLMPIFRATVKQLHVWHPRLRVVIPTVTGMAESVAEFACDWPVPVTIVQSDEDKYDSFAASTAALACSGTISIELAMARLPAIIAYKVSPLTALLARGLLKIKYATLINIMRDRLIMPEYLQGNCTPDKLAGAVHALLNNPDVREKQIEELAAVAIWLGKGQFAPSDRAAQVVLDVVGKEKCP